MRPELVERLRVVDNELCSGTSALVALIFNGKMYISNIGKPLHSFHHQFFSLPLARLILMDTMCMAGNIKHLLQQCNLNYFA